MDEALIGSIYEAAFIPERWNSVLEALRVSSQSASGSLLIFDRQSPPRWKTTARTRQVLERFATTEAWKKSERDPLRLAEATTDDRYFHCLNDLMTPDQLERDTVRQLMEEVGVAWQIGTTIAMPTDEHVVFTFERNIAEGRHDPESISRLTVLRPHLARAGMIATRLGIERARGALDALTGLGLPAALLDRKGQVRDTNELMTPALIATRGGGRLVLGNPGGDAALAAILTGTSTARSIALPPTATQPGRVAQIFPLLGEARDIFAGSMSLLVMNLATGMPQKPDLAILSALFDLSPAESRLAASLASGSDLADSAKACGIRLVRLDPISSRSFAKPGFIAKPS